MRTEDLQHVLEEEWRWRMPPLWDSPRRGERHDVGMEMENMRVLPGETQGNTKQV
jgi:hypothetical protein